MMKENSLTLGLKDQVCIVTGGAGVIGTAICRGLAKEGVKTVIADLNEEMAKKVSVEIQKEFNTNCMGISVNVLDKDSLNRAKEQINKEMGPINMLINGAGGNHPSATTKVEQMTKTDLENLAETFYGLNMEGFDKVFALNFTGTVLPSMVFSQDMLKTGKGVMLNISSMNSFSPLTKIPAYSAAKASINNFTQWLAVHLAKMNIRVNAIAPGFFLTRQNRFLLLNEDGTPTSRGARIIDNTPMGRYGEVDELVGTALYLLSEASKFVTGVVIPVDGGYSAFGGV